MRKGIDFKMRGRYAEIDEVDRVRLFEIHVCDYDKKAIKRLTELGVLESSRTGEYLSLVKEDVPDTTRYLYKLMTYTAEKNIDDLWLFNESILEFRELGFYDLKMLLKYCFDQWGLTMKDFKPESETSIP